MTACDCFSTKGNTAIDRCNDNFASVLRQIENETQRDLRRQHLLDERLRTLAQEPKRCENPLRYQLIPQRYRMKHQGYAVCRLCAEQSCHHPVPPYTSFSQMDYLRENLPEHPARTMNNDECYLTVELGCCLARITHLMSASVKALKELEFVSGNMYPMLGNDITYLNGLYLRMKSNYTQYRTLKMKQMTPDNKALPLTVEAVELFQKSQDANDKVHCNLLEDAVDEGNKRSFEGDLHKISNTVNFRNFSESDRI
ncbi:hypothetical protein LOAG_03704 [Loa loa]|uniref:Uncharacterized protein n=1 Tax=Loa loa TaxID=7209 RepID=A0A1I7VJQ3_LOALO|nr:hypothetical protein LOAG_03704 [Loa loa]EFO24776.1 hypothetical protein LOAG_03704 [Loa loa]